VTTTDRIIEEIPNNMTPAEREFLSEVIELFNQDTQILTALEELSELSVELHHAFPVEATRDDKVRLNQIKEEIADVRIMLDQLEIIFGDTSGHRERKLARLSKRTGIKRRG
jgi:NTP pyrophosphatase (non-canonical NTP hydrolase)